MSYITHKLIKPETIEARLYQEVLVTRIIEKRNTLVVAPTALGKTIVAVMLAAHTLEKTPGKKILFLAPTKPLVVQHENSFKKFLAIEENKIVSITGTTKAKEREKLYKEKTIINATPQTIENDILTGKMNLKEFGLVIYDECLEGNSRVLLGDGTEKPINEIVDELAKGKEFFVQSFDLEKKCIVIKRVLKGQKIPNLKKMIKIETDSEKTLITTQDHPFLATRRNTLNWIKAGDLCLTDQLRGLNYTYQTTKTAIIIDDADIIKLYSRKETKNIEIYQKAIGLHKKFGYGQKRISQKINYSERQIENWLYKGIKPRPLRTVDAMKSIGLLPFTNNGTHAELIARLMGHIFGDGWITKGKTGGFYAIGFSGQEKDLRRIQEDLKKISIQYSNISTRKTTSKINENIVHGTTNSFICCDKRLTRLMVLLGAPIGEKTKQKTFVPNWILTSSKPIKRAFLSSFFGSEGDCLLEKNNARTFYAPSICMNKTQTLEKNGSSFFSKIKKLLNEFDVKTSKITVREGNTNKDGIKTKKIIMRLSNSNKNLANFCRNISYSYCLDKEEKALKILAYLDEKKANIQDRDILQKKALLLKKDGFDNNKIAKMLNLPLHQIEHWAYNKYNSNTLQTSFPKFIQYPDKTVIGDPENIKQITTAKKEEFVYDLTIEDTHNFIANGLVVHNCHRAIGDYAYVFINLQLQKQNPSCLVLALTASPGSEEEHIQDVCRNLAIKNIEIKDQNDSDVKPYVKEIEIDWVKVELPQEFLQIKQYLENFQKKQLLVLKKLGFALTENKKYYNKFRLLEMQSNIRKRLALHGKTQPSLYYASSKCASMLKVSHAEELIETQGIGALSNYFNKLIEEAHKGKSKAANAIINDEDIKLAIHLTHKLFEQKIQHPKYAELKRIIIEQLKREPKSKIIVFNHYRDSIIEVVEFLTQGEGSEIIKPRKFIGQATKGNEKGMSQKIQQEVLEELRADVHNVLVASSVAEEGLDIPSVDLVIFFEPVPSEIRTIQRRGRTGRHEKGKMIVLMAKNTRDEAFYWTARSKERKMKNTLHEMKKIQENSPRGTMPQQTLLQTFSEPGTENKIIIFVDSREQASNVNKELFAHEDVKVIQKPLDIGDYVLSKDVCVERKTIEDFINSMIDGRLFPQLINLRQNYSKPLILLEGNREELYTLRNIHKNSIIGALTSIALDYQVPIINVRDAQETAEYLYNIAKREQIGREKEVSLRIGRKGLTLAEQQRFIVEGLPLVGPLLAKALLEKFGSIKSIVDADEKQLQEVENLGKKKARAIQKVLREKYDEKKNIYENWENEGEGNEEKAQEITLESEDEIVIDEEPSED